MSLSEEGSLLSQWRSYTTVSQGLSVGFDTRILTLLAQRQQFRLGKCIYTKEETLDVCTAVARLTIAHAVERGAAPLSVAHPTQSYHPAFFELENEIVQLAALFKHFAFAEEKEWRLVSPILPNYVEAPLKHRAGATSIIPYLEFGLRNEADQRSDGGGAIRAGHSRTLCRFQSVRVIRQSGFTPKPSNSRLDLCHKLDDPAAVRVAARFANRPLR